MERRPALYGQGAERSGCALSLPGSQFDWHEDVCVTDHVYMDISIGGQAAGRLDIGLFGDVVPLSTENFKKLCTCELATNASTAHLCFHGDGFHRLLPRFVIQGGSHATGRSIYGATFREEFNETRHTFLSHKGGRGVLAWAEYPIGSQFYIILDPGGLAYLDGNHVVFGTVLAGLDVVEKMEGTSRNGEKPSAQIKIDDSGVL